MKGKLQQIANQLKLFTRDLPEHVVDIGPLNVPLQALYSELQAQYPANHDTGHLHEAISAEEARVLWVQVMIADSLAELGVAICELAERSVKTKLLLVDLEGRSSEIKPDVLNGQQIFAQREGVKLKQTRNLFQRYLYLYLREYLPDATAEQSAASVAAASA